jgi:hypothetical protein
MNTRCTYIAEDANGFSFRAAACLPVGIDAAGRLTPYDSRAKVGAAWHAHESPAPLERR